MSKIRVYSCRLILLCLLNISLLSTKSLAQYPMQIIPIDKDSSFPVNQLGLQTNFKSNTACLTYIDKIPGLLKAKGYLASSIDSLYIDSARAELFLFVGQGYKTGNIVVSAEDRKTLEQIGWNRKTLQNKALDIAQLERLQERLLEYFDDNGYPFAKVSLDSISLMNDEFSAKLLIDKGPLYKIDSIRTEGTAKISNKFLQRYLGIPSGGIYQRGKLENIDKKLLELPYLQQQHPWDMTMLGTGSVLNLYLQQKKSSQVNVLVGFLPANDQLASNKLLITGEANINLRNALGSGETIGVNWQQIQVKSPRLNLLYQQPYIFGTAFGASTSFDLFKKDSSYLNLNFILGLQYSLSANKSGKIFFQSFRTNLLTVDTAAVRASKKLPDQLDVSINNLGVDYEWNKTNYRYNPRKGSELHVVASAGLKTIRENNTILKMSDPDFSYSTLYDTVKLNSYQARIMGLGAHYFPLGKAATLKIAVNAGLIQSPAIYRNELFQIGGYKLLRGFDEESIFASGYAVATAEYRYLIGLNSFLFSFVDLGYAANKSVYADAKNTFIGAGLGLAFETKAGVFNISYAAGKRDDVKFNIRQAKIHLGYVNYF